MDEEHETEMTDESLEAWFEEQLTITEQAQLLTDARV